jgi:hypothetical protein
VVEAYQEAEAQLWALGLQLEAAPGADALQPPPQLQLLLASDTQQLRVLAAVLTPPGLRPLHREAAPPHTRQLLEKAARLVAVAAQQAEGEGAAASGGDGTAAEAAAAGKAAQSLLLLPFRELELLLLAAHRHQHQELLGLLAGLAAVCCTTAAQLDTAAASADSSSSSSSSSSQDAAAAKQLAALSDLLAAVSALEEQQAGAGGEAAATRGLAAALAAHCGVLAAPHPGLLRDAALLLHSRARGLLARVACLVDAGSELALDVCQVLHAVFSAVDLGDAPLRLQCALHAGALLEEAGHHGAAAEVLGQALVACEAARSEVLQVLRGREGAELLWASGSRSQPTAEAQELMRGRGWGCLLVLCVCVGVCGGGGGRRASAPWHQRCHVGMPFHCAMLQPKLSC